MLSALLLSTLLAQPPGGLNNETKLEHQGIGVVEVSDEAFVKHTEHPDAQWFPEAGLGLFIHWGLASVKAINISWPMMEGRGNPAITPNEYWKQVESFDPRKYDPNKWLKAAKAAGFTYAVFTTPHHEGFAMWPSAFGGFDTRNHMGGRDLVKPYVEACRKNGLKVGFYYSPPDWYFDKDYVNFGRKSDNKVPLDADHKPRTGTKSAAEIAKHRAEYMELV